MYTNHFYKRMGERVHKNEKRLNHKEEKRQKGDSKSLLNKALKHKIAEYIDTYGTKFIYAYYNEICYKFIFKNKKILTVYEVNLEKEKLKYELRYI